MMHERRMAYRLCPFYSISVISGRWDADNERLCAMEPSYWLERFPPLAGFEPGTARAAGQGFTYWATGLPKVYEAYVHSGSNQKVLIAHPCKMFFMTFFFSYRTFHFYANLSNMTLKDAYGWHR